MLHPEEILDSDHRDTWDASTLRAIGTKDGGKYGEEKSGRLVRGIFTAAQPPLYLR